MKDFGKAYYLLGLRIIRKKERISIDQEYYIEKILKKYQIVDYNPIRISLDKDLKLRILKKDKEIVNKKEYKSVIRALNYLIVMTRSDIVTTVGIVSRYMKKTGKIYWLAIKRILRYLKGTVNYGLVFEKRNRDICLEVYCDADYAGYLDDRKSTSGYILILGETVVNWKSVKQECTALSTLEVEYISTATATKEVIWMRRLLNELGFKQGVTVMKTDNEGAKNLANNNMISKRSKHIDTRYYYIRDVLKEGDIKLVHCAGRDNTADVFTKAIPLPRFRECREELGVRQIQVEE